MGKFFPKKRGNKKFPGKFGQKEAKGIKLRAPPPNKGMGIEKPRGVFPKVSCKIKGRPLLGAPTKEKKGGGN